MFSGYNLLFRAHEPIFGIFCFPCSTACGEVLYYVHRNSNFVNKSECHNTRITVRPFQSCTPINPVHVCVENIFVAILLEISEIFFRFTSSPILITCFALEKWCRIFNFDLYKNVRRRSFSSTLCTARALIWLDFVCRNRRNIRNEHNKPK